MDRNIALAVAMGVVLGGFLAVLGVSLMPSDPIRPVCGVLLLGIALTCVVMTTLNGSED